MSLVLAFNVAVGRITCADVLQQEIKIEDIALQEIHQAAKEHAEFIAEKLRLFNTIDIIYDRVALARSPVAASMEQYKKDATLLNNFFAKNYPAAFLLELLNHPGPQVRTLGLAGLFAKEDPKLLPHIAAMIADNAPTFLKEEAIAYLYPPQVESVPTQPQTVGEIARQMVDFYMQQASYYYEINGPANCPGFNDYWSQRKDLEHIANWFSVRMRRAAQGRSPIGKDREHKFQAIRRDIKNLTGPQRAWYTLFVGTLDGGDRVFSREELFAAAKALGRAQLVLLLDQNIPINDPDLSAKNGEGDCGGYEWIGHKMAGFIIENSATLLDTK